MIRAAAALEAARLVGHRARAIAHPLDRGTWDALDAADVVLAKGGSYLYSNGALRSRIFLWRMRYLLGLSTAMGRAPALMGVTVGPLQSRGTRRDVRATLTRCRQVYVRENLSAVYLARIGVGVARASDMAFLLEPPTPGVRLTAPPPLVALTIRALPFAHSGSPDAARRRFSAAIRDTLTSLLESDPQLRIVLVVQVAADAAPSRAAVRGLSYPEDRLSIAHATTPDELMPIYARATVLVATRLHSTIFAALVGTPSIHIVSDPHKGYGISQDLGLSRWCVAADELDHRSLTSLINQLITDRDTVSPMVVERVAGLRHDAQVALADALARRETPSDVKSVASCARLRVGRIGHRGVSRGIPDRVTGRRPPGVARAVRRVRLRLGAVPDCEPAAVGLRPRLCRPHGTSRTAGRPRCRLPSPEASRHRWTRHRWRRRVRTCCNSTSGGNYTPAATAGLVAGCVFGLFQTSMSRLQAHQRFRDFGRMVAIYNLVALAVTVVLLALGVTSAAVLLTAYAVSGTPWVWRLRRFAHTGRTRATRTGFVRHSRWLVASSLVYGLALRAELFLATLFLTAGAFATYAAPARMFALVEFTMATMGAVLLPNAAGLSSSAELEAYVRRGVSVTLGCALVGGVVALERAPLANTLIGSSYHAAGLVPVFCLAAVVMSSYTSLKYLLFTARMPGHFAAVNTTMLIVKIVAGVILIPLFGAVGAAWSVVAAYTVSTCVITLLVRNLRPQLTARTRAAGVASGAR